MDIKATVQEFDQFLFEHQQAFSAVIIGGAALSLLKIISRVTNDIDVVNPKSLPLVVGQLAKEFAKRNHLPEGWLNCAPADVVSYLPKGWENRTEKIYKGKKLTLITLGRMDLILTKCWAYCDRQRDLDDLVAMSLTKEEIKKAHIWLKPLDQNPGWPDYVDQVMAALSKACGY
jgi:hypothetical protein